MNGSPEFIPLIESVLEELPSSDYWIKHNLEGARRLPDGKVIATHCLIGAAMASFRKLGLLTPEGPWERTITHDFHDFCEWQCRIDHGSYSIVSWNDHPDTTYEDVVLWVKSLIDHCREA